MKVKQGIRGHEKHVSFSHTQQGMGGAILKALPKCNMFTCALTR